jgi:hypothetical protein
MGPVSERLRGTVVATDLYPNPPHWWVASAKYTTGKVVYVWRRSEVEAWQWLGRFEAQRPIEWD